MKQTEPVIINLCKKCDSIRTQQANGRFYCRVCQKDSETKLKHKLNELPPPKLCMKCGIQKTRAPSGQTYCKVCSNEKAKLHYAANKEHLIEYSKNWNIANKERRRAYEQERYLKNKNESPLKSTLHDIKNRCYNPNYVSYHSYGGRRKKPIKVCNRWLGSNGYEHFVQDMFPTWKPGLTIERVDVDGDYTPDNCIWIENKLQSHNTRRNLNYKLRVSENTIIEYLNTTMTLKEMSKVTLIHLDVIRYRYVDAIRLNYENVSEYIVDLFIPGRNWLYNKKCYQLIELELLSGISKDVIQQRVKRHGWSIDRAVNTPVI